MRLRLLPASMMVAAVLALPAGTAAYLYIPDVLVVSTGSEADDFLDQLEVRFGVAAAPEPGDEGNKNAKRLDRLERAFQKHWQALDAACDPNAVFARMYLTTTGGVRQHIREEYFAENDYLSVITVLFAQLYFNAYDAWKAGRVADVPKPWYEAFQWAKSGQSSITEDQFLGMNAHINYDLAVAEAAMGLWGPQGQWRKADMDRINHVLHDVTDDVGYDIARYYGPSSPTSPPSQAHQPPMNYSDANTLILEPIYGWREHAWKNAEVLAGETDPLARKALDAEMQQYAWTIAQGLKSPKLVSPAAERAAYCAASA